MAASGRVTKRLVSADCGMKSMPATLLRKQRLRLFCPNTQLIAAGISELETATAWKVIRAIHYAPTGTDDRIDARI